MSYTSDGTPVTHFSVASNRRWNGDNPGEETTWFRVTAWGRLAEVCNDYLKKGRQVLVEGRLQPSETGGPRIWTGDDGVARASFEVRAQVVKFPGGRGDDGNGADQSSSQAPPASPEDVNYRPKWATHSRVMWATHMQVECAVTVELIVLREAARPCLKK